MGYTQIQQIRLKCALSLWGYFFPWYLVAFRDLSVSGLYFIVSGFYCIVWWRFVCISLYLVAFRELSDQYLRGVHKYLVVFDCITQPKYALYFKTQIQGCISARKEGRNTMKYTRIQPNTFKCLGEIRVGIWGKLK